MSKTIHGSAGDGRVPARAEAARFLRLFPDARVFSLSGGRRAWTAKRARLRTLWFGLGRLRLRGILTIGRSGCGRGRAGMGWCLMLGICWSMSMGVTSPGACSRRLLRLTVLFALRLPGRAVGGMCIGFLRTGLSG